LGNYLFRASAKPHTCCYVNQANKK